jgi:hypothetical protein
MTDPARLIKQEPMRTGAICKSVSRRLPFAARRPVIRLFDAFLHEPFLPAPDAGLRLAGPAHDLVGANTVGRSEDDRRPSVFLRGVTVPGDRFKSAADGPHDRDGNSGAHAPDSHGNRKTQESQSGLFCQAKTTRLV